MRARQAQYQVDEETESQLRSWNAEGKTLTWCAQQMNWELSKASRICKRLGLLWDGNNPGMRAMADRESRKMATLRTQLANQLLADAIALRERIWEEYTIVAVTKDGLDTIDLDLPDAKAVADFTKAVDSLVKSHTNLAILGQANGQDLAASMLGQLFQMVKEAVSEAEGDTETGEGVSGGPDQS